MSQVTRQEFLESLHNGVDLENESLQQALDGTRAMTQLRKADLNGDGKLTGEEELGRAFVTVERFDPHHGQQSFEDSDKAARVYHALQAARLGQWKASEPAAPDANTIVCSGYGGIDVQVGANGDMAQLFCAADCIRQHEFSHRADALAANPEVCHRKPRGTRVDPADEQVLAATELKAANVELECLHKRLKLPDDTCKSTLQARLQEEETWRDSFKK